MAGKPLAPKVFDCPSCGSGVVIRAQGISISVVCRACGSIIDSANENYQVISKAAQKLKIDPPIPLGQRGKLHGVLWEVIGYMMRQDGSGAYKWSEYLLFNPMKGFRWLTEFDGHWNYVVQTKEKPKLDREVSAAGVSQNGAKVFGKCYHLFHRGTAKVIYVLGEFYWRVQVGEKVAVEDYVLPPEILSSEKSKDEMIWSIGEYIKADTIRAAFQITGLMPVPIGIAPNQPSLVSSVAPFTKKYWVLFVAIILGIQIFTIASAKREEVYRGVFTYRGDDPQKQRVTPQFELKHGVSNLDFVLYSEVQNSWLAIEADLVNDQTGETYEFEQGIEYYSGYDSDGSWTEGSRVSHEILSAIPDGLYHLNFQATGPAPPSPSPGSSPSPGPSPFPGPSPSPWSLGAVSQSPSPGEPLFGQSYYITITRDVVTWSSFFWGLLLVSVYPIFVWFRNRSFEQARWSTSDFSPYWSQQGED